jgi:hypothetical protein
MHYLRQGETWEGQGMGRVGTLALPDLRQGGAAVRDGGNPGHQRKRDWVLAQAAGFHGCCPI